VGLERFEKASDFWVTPVFGTDETTTNSSLSIYDEGLRPTCDGKFVSGRLLRIANGNEINVSLGYKPLVIAVVSIGTDSEDGDLRVIMVELQERG